MARFDDWVTDPAVSREGVEAFLADLALVGESFLGKYAVCQTSGTTGVAGMFLQDAGSLSVGTAMTLVRGVASLIRVRRSTNRGGRFERRTAYVLATGGHYAGYAITKRVRRQHPRLAKRNRTFSVLAPLPELVRELNEFQPTVLNGYPNAITVLAHEQQAGRLRIHPWLVVTFSETLDDETRGRIADAFGCVTRSWYGAAEAESIAYDCDEGWLHVNADWVLLEPVTADYRPVPAGTESETVLLTNLANRVQPIVRYDLGDRILLKPEPCSCGNPLPALRVAGRLHDIPVFTGPGGEKREIMPELLCTACIETPGVRKSQVVQTAPDRLLVRFDEQPEASRQRVWLDLSERLRGRLADQGVPFVELELDPAPPRPDPVSGKYRTVAVEIGKPGVEPAPSL
jgi:phenylacetate-coenzyme A ligase PaaK-like adenylate-forming protein